MKIDLSKIDRENFMVHEHTLNGEQVFLVQPVHIGAKWTPETMIFRSSVWDAEGNLISASYPKFFNWGEHPELTPPPGGLADAELFDKIDGSTLIYSRRNGYTIRRTRGTVTVASVDNGYEVDFLLEKYPKVKERLESADTLPYSIIFEWVSPTNVIVLNYGDEPDMILTGVIQHADYRLESQNTLDRLAAELGVKRPAKYKYDSISDMQAAVAALRGKEGLCVYYNNGQNILKVKSAEYLYLHRAKSEVSSIEKVMDVYLNLWVTENKFYTYQEFFDYLERIFDYEIANLARGHISSIADAMKEVKKIVQSMEEFVAPLRGKLRRDAAIAIQQAYGTTSRCGYAFKLLDNKPLDADAYKKLIFQVLKN